jgi:hypothetical protein
MDEREPIVAHAEETILRLVAEEAAAVMALPDGMRRDGAHKLKRIAEELAQFADELLM